MYDLSIINLRLISSHISFINHYFDFDIHFFLIGFDLSQLSFLLIGVFGDPFSSIQSDAFHLLLIQKEFSHSLQLIKVINNYLNGVFINPEHVSMDTSSQ